MNMTLLKLLHAIGLTNLSDNQVADYIQLKRKETKFVLLRIKWHYKQYSFTLEVPFKRK